MFIFDNNLNPHNRSERLIPVVLSVYFLDLLLKLESSLFLETAQFSLEKEGSSKNTQNP